MQGEEFFFLILKELGGGSQCLSRAVTIKKLSNDITANHKVWVVNQSGQAKECAGVKEVRNMLTELHGEGDVVAIEKPARLMYHNWRSSQRTSLRGRPGAKRPRNRPRQEWLKEIKDRFRSSLGQQSWMSPALRKVETGGLHIQGISAKNIGHNSSDNKNAVPCL